MNKFKSFLTAIFIFLVFLGYLHQNISVYVEAYRLSGNYARYNELVDKKDYLMYNFAKETSIAKVNQWAMHENFTPVSRDRILVMRTPEKGQEKKGILASLLDRVSGAGAYTAQASAGERQ